MGRILRGFGWVCIAEVFGLGAAAVPHRRGGAGCGFVGATLEATRKTYSRQLTRRGVQADGPARLCM